jgi:hypothetical protein
MPRGCTNPEDFWGPGSLEDTGANGPQASYPPGALCAFRRGQRLSLGLGREAVEKRLLRRIRLEPPRPPHHCGVGTNRSYGQGMTAVTWFEKALSTLFESTAVVT